jgi:hypothetical protein
MNDIRRIVGFLLAAMALTLFALPAIADHNDESFSLVMSPPQVPAGTTQVTATIKNMVGDDDRIKSFRITAPTGVTVNSATSASVPASNISIASGVVSVKNVNLRSGQSIAMTLGVTFPGTANCGLTTFTWGGQAWENSNFSGESFSQDGSSKLTTKVAGVCNYGITMSPGAVAAGSSPTLAATFSNPAASTSSFNSVTLTAPAGMTITGASLTSGTGTVSTLPATSVTISGITPAVASGSSVGVSLQTSVACTGAGGGWGSAVGGGFTNQGSNPSTTVTGACALQFLQQPVSAASGVPFPVQVTAVDGNGAPVTSFAGPVTLALVPVSGSGSLASGSSTAAGGVVTFPGVTIAGSGQFKLSASSTVGSTALSVNTSQFALFAGVLDCGGTLDPTLTNPGGGTFGTPGYAEGKRGSTNKNGSNCVLVNYTFTNSILATDTVSLKWDTTTQPNAAFSYTMTWQDEPVDPATGMPTRRTKVGFQVDTYGNPIYNFGVACVSGNLPAQYTALAAAVDNVQTTMTVTTSATLPPVPFPATIDTERVLVTNVAGAVWTVTRGNGGTTASGHAAAAPVMSTPLPIDPNPTLADGTTPNAYQNKQVPMCIYDEGWTSAGGGMVRFSTSVIDIGDGFATRTP